MDLINNEGMEVEENHSHTTIYIVTTIIAVLIIGMLVFYTIGRESLEGERVLTEKDKIEILDSLTANSKSKYSREEQQSILDDVSEKSSSKLSDEEKKQILDSLTK